MKIESLKDYIGKINRDEFIKLAISIYNIADCLTYDYPQLKKWYFTKHLPAITTETRNILFVRNPENYNEIIAMTCLKKDEEEQKICTLYVSDKCRGLGIGTTIIEESMKWLETTKPFITFAEYKLDMFTPIIKKYDWELTETVDGLYNDNYKELCFNGTLTKNNKPDLYKRLIRTLDNRSKQLENNQ